MGGVNQKTLVSRFLFRRRGEETNVFFCSFVFQVIMSFEEFYVFFLFFFRVVQGYLVLVYVSGATICRIPHRQFLTKRVLVYLKCAVIHLTRKRPPPPHWLDTAINIIYILAVYYCCSTCDVMRSSVFALITFQEMPRCSPQKSRRTSQPSLVNGGFRCPPVVKSRERESQHATQMIGLRLFDKITNEARRYFLLLILPPPPPLHPCILKII